MTKNEAMLVNPEDFGLEQTQAIEITDGLNQILDERTTLSEMYAETIKLEIIEENIPAFKALRLKIRDNRTKGIEAWHKVNKEFYLRGGQFVDAIKRKEVAENERMEWNLLECEKHFENLEIDRLNKLQQDRAVLVSQYVEDASLLKLSEMDDDVFDAFLSAKKQSYEKRLEEEAKIEAERLEAEKKVQLYKTRKEELLPLWNFLKEDHKSIDFGEIPEESFRIILDEVKETKVAHEKQVEAQRLENEKLKKEAEDREKADKIRLAKEREEREKNESKLKAEKEAREKIEAELKAKKDAEEKAEKERLAEEERQRKEAEKLAKAPEKERLISWVNSLTVGTPPVMNDTIKDIIEKFEGFKDWARTEIHKS